MALSLIIALLLIAAAPAAATEYVLSERPGSGVIAHGGYVAWSEDSARDRVLWHGGTIIEDSGLPFSTTLGSDSAKRAVGIFTYCAGGVGRDCTVRQRVLPPNGSRRLYTHREGEHLPVGAMYRGTFALIAGGTATGEPAPARALYIRRPGSRRLERVVKVGRASNLAIGARQAAFMTIPRRGEERQIRVIDLDSRRDRLYAENDTFDDDCRCSATTSRLEGGPVIAGRYAYWLEITFRTGDSAGTRSHIGRARMDIGLPEIEYYETERVATSFAIRGSRIVYTSGFLSEPAAVLEVTEPAWRRSGGTIPARP